MKKLAFISILLFTSHALTKLKIDVSVRLSENLCNLVDSYKTNLRVQGELKSPKEEVLDGPGECFIWHWTKCDHNAGHPCSTWEKKPCKDPGKIIPKAEDCTTHHCGWTLDELNQHWDFNPEHVHPKTPDRPPNHAIIETGATLDFPFMKDNDID